MSENIETGSAAEGAAEPGAAKHAAAFSWVQYRAMDESGDTLRVFNAVDAPMPLVTSIKGRKYRQVTFEYFTQKDVKLGPGDWVQRFLAPKEAHMLAEQDAKAKHRSIPKNVRPPVEQLKNELLPKWKRKTVFSLLEAPKEP